jgi:type III restriction enzyme
MLQKDRGLALQVDVTATPKHNNGAIFVQTISDYPLVEAIYQNVVKHPTLPDAASVARLHEQQTAIFSDRYADYLRLGIEEWRQSFAVQEKLGKKAVLFVMVDDTRNCDDVGTWLEKTAPELQGAVLVIHTKQNGDISEAGGGKGKEELESLRKAANSIDSWESPYKAIVSVLMLKEGWDVRNVTTIVGLRAYNSPARILPEQTLGRGLRRMYFGSDEAEHVSVIGTPAFIEFVESIRSEGVEFEHKPMGPGGAPAESLVVEVDASNPDKDLDALDIAIPKLERRYDREYKDLVDLDSSKIQAKPLPLQAFTPDEVREIVFKTMLDDQVHHTVELDTSGIADWRPVIAFFTRQLLKDLRLVGGYDLLYPQVRDFVRARLFVGGPVDLTDPVVLRNLSEPAAGKVIFDTFKAAINDLTVRERGSSRIEDRIRLRDMRPFRTGNRAYLPAKKSVFDKIVPEAVGGGFELEFAKFLEQAADVASFAKNYLAVGFKIDYVKSDGDLSSYYPDFLVKASSGDVFIVETKGRADLDVPRKMGRLKQWCADATEASGCEPPYRFVYVDEAGFKSHRPRDFAALAAAFREYQ